MLRKSGAILPSLLVALAIPACSAQQMASRTRLPISVLSGPAEETIVLRSIDSNSDAPVEQPAVRSVVLPESATSRLESAKEMSAPPDDPTRWKTGRSHDSYAAHSSSAQADQLSQKIRHILQNLEQSDPAQAEEFLRAVRDASAGERLEQVIAAWQVTADFMQRSAYAGRQEIRREDTRGVQTFADHPSRDNVVSSSRRDASGWPVHDDGVPRQRYHDDRNDRPDREPPRQQPVQEAYTSSDRQQPEPPATDEPFSQFRETTTADGSRKIQFQRRPDPEVQPTHYETAKPMYGGDVKEQMRDLAWRLQSSRAEHPVEQLKDQVSSRLLYAALGDQRQALQPLQGVDPFDGQYWQHMIQAQLDYFDQSAGIPFESRLGEVVQSLHQALKVIEQRAPLVISKPILCKKVHNFGNYEEFDEYRFRSGDGVVVYWEVENFQSVSSRKGFRTSMDATFEIYDTAGKKRHESQHPFTDDYCERKRTDYFNAVLFQFPEDLGAGDYILKVILHDKTSDKVAENQCRFTMIGN